MSTRNRALVYIRKSIVRNATDAISPERQRAACLAEAERHGWLVEDDDVYADAEGHQSGRTDNRVDWQRLRRRIRHDETVVAVIVESLSRASRSVRDFFAFVEELRARGVGLVSLKERFDTSNAIGQAMLGFIAVVNQLESDLASERMKMNIAFKKSRGRHWGLAPFGCQREPVTGALRPSEETYTLDGETRRYYDSLVACYELYQVGEYSLEALARELNARDWRFRARNGTPRLWDENNVRSVLMMHRVYAGWVPLRGHNKDKPEEWIRGNYDPILPLELCEAVQAALEARSKTWRLPEPKVRGRRTGSARREPSPYVLTGILYCAACGARLKGYTARGVRHYRHEVRGECSQSWYGAEEIEEEAADLVGRLRLPPDVVQIAVEEVLASVATGNREEAEAELDGISEELRRVATEQERLVELAIHTGLHTELYQRQIRRLEEERALLDARQREIERAQSTNREDLVWSLTQTSEMAAALAQAAEPDVRRDLLHSILERVEVADGHIAHWTPREWCRPFF